MFGSKSVTLLLLLGLAVGSQSEQPSNARQGLGCVLAPPTAPGSDAVVSKSESKPAETPADTDSTASEPAAVNPSTDDTESYNLNQINGKHVVLPKPSLSGKRPGGKSFVSAPVVAKNRPPQSQNAVDAGPASDTEESTTSAPASEETTSAASTAEDATVLIPASEETTAAATEEITKAPVRTAEKVVPGKPVAKSSNTVNSASQASDNSQSSGGSAPDENTSGSEEVAPAVTEEVTKAPVRPAGKVIPAKPVPKSSNKVNSVSQPSKDSRSFGGSAAEGSSSGSEQATPDAQKEVIKTPVRTAGKVVPEKSVAKGSKASSPVSLPTKNSQSSASKSSNKVNPVSQPSDNSQSSGGSAADDNTSGSDEAAPTAKEEAPKAPIRTAGKVVPEKPVPKSSNTANPVSQPSDESSSSGGTDQSTNEGEDESPAAPVKPVPTPVKPRLPTVGEVVKPPLQPVSGKKESQLIAQSDKSPAPTQREGKAAPSLNKAKQNVELLQAGAPAPATLTIAKKPSKYVVPGAIFVAGQADASQGTTFNPGWKEQTTLNPQGNLWEELDKLRGGRSPLTAGEIQEILAKAVAGTDYPIHSYVPTTSFTCEKVNQPGYYADSEGQCQVIRRCDANGIQWNYLCPNATLFNQITLTCDWYFNVDCSRTSQFYDYSNARLYHSEWPFLDTPAQ